MKAESKLLDAKGGFPDWWDLERPGGRVESRPAGMRMEDILDVGSVDFSDPDLVNKVKKLMEEAS